MKKLIAILMLFPVAAFAATTGSLTLTGSIPKIVNVLVTPQVGYNTLDLTTTASNKLVAIVNEQSNDAQGYTVRISSANAGVLKNGTIGNVTYTARYNSTAFTLSLTPQTVTSVASQVATVNANKNLDISYTGTSSQMSGSYTDTLTISIVAN